MSRLCGATRHWREALPQSLAVLLETRTQGGHTASRLSVSEMGLVEQKGPRGSQVSLLSQRLERRGKKTVRLKPARTTGETGLKEKKRRKIVKS